MRAAVLASSPNPSAFEEKVTLVATISPKVPDGTVITFKAGTGAIGTARTKGGKARLVTAGLAVGSHSIKAYTSETALTLASVSEPIVQVVKTNSRKKTTETIASFSDTRNDLMLSHDPSTPRQVDRLIDFNNAEAEGEAQGFASTPLAPAG